MTLLSPRKYHTSLLGADYEMFTKLCCGIRTLLEVVGAFTGQKLILCHNFV